MRVAVICIDKPNSLEVRMANRPAHVDHLNASGVVESIEQAQAWVAQDAYTQAGLFASVDIREWKKVIG